MTHRYPLALHTCASPIPVFPAVPSTTVPPGFNLSKDHRVSPPRRKENDTRNEPPGSLSIANDPESSTVLDTPSRVLKLGFPVNLSPSLLRQLLEVNLVKPRASVRPFASMYPISKVEQGKNRSNENVERHFRDTH